MSTTSALRPAFLFPDGRILKASSSSLLRVPFRPSAGWLAWSEASYRDANLTSSSEGHQSTGRESSTNDGLVLSTTRRQNRMSKPARSDICYAVFIIGFIGLLHQPPRFPRVTAVPRRFSRASSPTELPPLFPESKASAIPQSGENQTIQS